MTNSTKPHRKLLKLGTGGLKMRLIDADALHADFINDLLCIKFGSALQGTPRSDIDVSNVLERIEEAPTIEAEPVRHGVWRLMHNSYDRVKEYNCSSCDANHIREYNFCPSCGAKMDGGDNST